MPARSARVWKRILAFLVDLYIGIMVFAAFFLILASEIPKSLASATHAVFSPVAFAALIYACIFLLLYHLFSEYIVGQTPGMLLFGIRVQHTQKNKPVRFWQALVRNLFLLPVFPFTILWLVEPIYYVLQGERLLEYWTNTETVE